MDNIIKLKKIAPFALSTLFLALTGCGGGESATVNEDPYAGVNASSYGCNWNSEQCQPFVVAYPVDGLNFDCSSDTRNHFVTKFESNASMGGCRTGDSVKFYINGVDTNKRIELGSVNLSELTPLKVSGQPTQISLMDIAKGMTGKAIAVTPVGAINESTVIQDDTYKTLLGLIQILQEIGVKEGSSTSSSDVQPVYLDNFLKNSGSNQTTKIKKDLDKLQQNVTVADFIDGTFIQDLAVWRNISAISKNDANTVAQQLINMKNAAVYSANFMAFPAVQGTLEGFNGTNVSDSSEKTIANLYTVTDRSGYSLGYVIQWIGKPKTNIEGFGRLELITQVKPVKLNTNTDSLDRSVKNWIDPLTDKITTPLKFFSPTNNSESLDFKQGQLVNQKAIPGNKFVYNSATNTTNQPDSSIYGAWSQVKDNKNYSGAIDLFKTGPVTYLDGQVFKNTNFYKFPLYLDLTFGFDDESLKSQSVVLSIAIDKNGNIRSNLKDGVALSTNSTANTSCQDVGADYKTLGSSVQQYRLGTVGTTNPDDNSLTVRMILANKTFGLIDGALIGLNIDLQNTAGITSEYMVYSSGVRINLPRTNLSQLTIKDFAENSTQASWLNMFASAQEIYNAGYNADKNSVAPTAEQLDLAKRASGKITKIEMTKCS